MSLSAQSNPPAAATYAPFAQLIKMLLPSARSVILYDTRRELVWCSDGYERPELRALLDVERAGDEQATRGSVETTSEGTPVFVSTLRGASGQPLGSLVVEPGFFARSRLHAHQRMAARSVERQAWRQRRAAARHDPK